METPLSGPESSSPAAFAAGQAGMVAVPELEVLGRLAAGDGPGFNEALVRALELYRDYTAEDLAAGSTTGILPVGLLALACLARDGAVEGVSLEVESDYLPAGIVNGSWPCSTTTRSSLWGPRLKARGWNGSWSTRSVP